ncbi:hypothetical protein P171DRAFT_250143 [Karstenula rhodostoma CBS 690.94]|uniref:Uncharacterized protein n=1 Tax=Karstenula rhodostoma CBS 690.94 TaxID=1392251 RepID=A0A9P4PNA7_9PLEO|nr:hypothetical protein P171DRAFT_250143 [Karstenula rhodostoma CBS 690.94]
MTVNMELAALPPAAAHPAHGDTADHELPPAYSADHEPLPPTYQDASQHLKAPPTRNRWFRNRLLLAVVLTLVTAAIIASLAAVFTIQARKRNSESPSPS